VSGQAVIGDQYYSMDPAVGFQQSSQGLYIGAALLGIHTESFSDRSVKRAAKRIFRQALAVLLGPTPLMSRRLLLGSRR
jgi:DNA repair protein RecO (recombination protein O)